MCDYFFNILYHAFTLEILNFAIQTCAVKVVKFVVGFGDSIEEDDIFGVGTSM